MVATYCTKLPKETILKAFAMLDENDDGFLSKDELEKIFHNQLELDNNAW